MRNLFRSGAVFLIIAGLCFVITAIKYFMTDNASPGGVVATGVVCLVIGLALGSKNT